MKENDQVELGKKNSGEVKRVIVKNEKEIRAKSRREKGIARGLEKGKASTNSKRNAARENCKTFLDFYDDVKLRCACYTLSILLHFSHPPTTNFVVD